MTAVESHVSPELAKAIGGCNSFIDEIAQVEAETSPLGNVAGTLNMPCLVSFLMLIENLGRIGMAYPITVLHDQDAQRRVRLVRALTELGLRLLEPEARC
jgi:hypothetical protein